MNIKIENSENFGKIEAFENNQKAGEITFVYDDKCNLIAEHTEVEQNFAGKGVGKILFLKLVDFAREKQIKIIPHCSFVKSSFDKIPDANDVLFK
jgi:predicted GNAT family acetyltransferase